MKTIIHNVALCLILSCITGCYTVLESSLKPEKKDVLEYSDYAAYREQYDFDAYSRWAYYYDSNTPWWYEDQYQSSSDETSLGSVNSDNETSDRRNYGRRRAALQDNWGSSLNSATAISASGPSGSLGNSSSSGLSNSVAIGSSSGNSSGGIKDSTKTTPTDAAKPDKEEVRSTKRGYGNRKTAKQKDPP